MKKLLLLVLPLVLLIGCKSAKMVSSETATSPNTIFQAIPAPDSPAENPYFYCSDFVENVYNSLTIDEMENKYGSLVSKEFEPIQNIHNDHLTDTILSFSSGSNLIQFLKARHADILLRVDITDGRITLFENIRPGMTKADFQTKFSIRHELPDVLEIGTSEQTSSFTFRFRAGKLSRISSDLYID
ncbi:MAG: hypothetical protein RBS53_05710 [Bacteroidales bacterium]|jgi:hypothetical protein|nr:hypothetical protein [Bacteroidales bacterium]NLM92892.1 hypothetical protein [Bacteroidales bacterium]